MCLPLVSCMAQENVLSFLCLASGDWAAGAVLVTFQLHVYSCPKSPHDTHAAPFYFIGNKGHEKTLLEYLLSSIDQNQMTTYN